MDWKLFDIKVSDCLHRWVPIQAYACGAWSPSGIHTWSTSLYLVTKLDWNTATSELLRQCEWLSVHHLSVYHTVMQAKSPEYLYNMFNTKYNYKTREANSGRVRNTRKPELGLAQDSFRWKAVDLFNQLPESIRSQQKLQTFKLQAKQWVRQNIELS